ncbi:MFS transporter [Mucilaginibacter xinganensis]|uniref:Putative arabinose efflux permease, MFS family n=1 Tax=Mucilaginibacter xinganensis TaxID=1234841 RepID=A0A223P2V7_9SPHI|nr:MFS transporter [Mucilaginibacter xinganensis]ASU36422.1 putative arabinose efflux permease, MFS family [Mucilaginibacter xinganensis]
MTNTAAIKKHPELTPLTLWIMTIATGLVVANLYYNQPLLEDIARTYHTTRAKAGQVSVLTQIGYATGLFFLAPLADMVKRKRLMVIVFAFIISSLLLTATAASINVLIIASFLIGATSMIPQILVPMAAHLAKPNERGKKIGVIMSGLLIGILLSRTFSGYIGEYFGWRAVYYIAAGIMLLMWAMVGLFLPEVEPDYKGTYRQLMASLAHLVRHEPKLRLAALRGALCFACFSAFWTTIVFLLKQNFDMGSSVAGEFGLVGAFGAIAAGLMGRLSDRMDAYKLSGFTLLLILISFIIFIFSAHSIIGLIIGVIVMDMGVQATHISNQSIIFALKPEARNRINTIYMVTYFIGGSVGTFFATQLWKSYQWNGVCITGITISVITLIIHFANHPKPIQKTTTV